MRAGLALIALPPWFLWVLLTTPLGWIALVVAIPLGIYTGINGLLYGPMNASDVPQYVKVVQVLRGPHTNAGMYGDAVTISISNHHPSRGTPARLWVACTTYGQADRSTPGDLGDYESLVAFEAAPLHDCNGDLHDQIVPAGATKNLEFNTQAALPDLNLRAGERVGTCVAGASKKQALVLVGYNRDDPHAQQGRMLTATPLAEKLGLHTGWQR
jgi:hypothetical protein